MSTNNEQNGRQPSIPQQAAPPTDPRIRSSNAAASEDGTCRDFVWGICTKGSQCKYRHVLNPESMKKILKFCHDFQNRSGCTRQGCTYLHTTNEEQILFLTTGLIPKVLRDRYAAANMYFVNQPPPPPPPLPPQNVLKTPGAHQPPPPPLPPPSQNVSKIPGANQPPLPAPLPALLAPPPPPPPPTISAPIFTAPPPISTTVGTSFPVAKETLPLVKIDTSKPPPPLPATKNGAVKRPAEPATAGPSKTRKQDVEHRLCETCIQRELRIEVFRKEIKKLEGEKEHQTQLFLKKSETFANYKLLLKSAVSSDLFHILDAYIEASSPSEQVPDIISQFNHVNPVVAGPSSSALQSQILLNMMELARNIVEGPRTSVLGKDTKMTKQTFMERLRKSCISHKPNSGGNGFVNGSTTTSVPGVTPKFTSPTTSTATLPSGVPVHITNKTHSVVDPQKRPCAQKKMHTQNVSHPLAAPQVRSALTQNGTGPRSPKTAPLIPNGQHPSLKSQPKVSHSAITKNTVHLQNKLLAHGSSQNTLSQTNMHSQTNTHSQQPTPTQKTCNATQSQAGPPAPPFQTAAPPPIRPYYTQHAAASKSTTTAYNSAARGVNGTRPTTSATTQNFSYIQRYPPPPYK